MGAVWAARWGRGGIEWCGRGGFCNGKEVWFAMRETLTGQAHLVRLLAK